MTKEAKKIIAEITLLLARENEITAQEQIRMLELLRKEEPYGEAARSHI